MSRTYTNYVWDAESQKWINVGGGPDSAKIYYDTKENWDLQRDLLSQKNSVYVYTNGFVIYDQVGNPTFKPNIKIGDGKAYLIDLPFIISDEAADIQTLSNMLNDHMADDSAHVSQEDREFWNSKVRAYVNDVQNEALILTTF